MPKDVRLERDEIIDALTNLEERITTLKKDLGTLSKGTRERSSDTTTARRGPKRVAPWPLYQGMCDPIPPRPTVARIRALEKLFIDISKALRR